MKPQIDIQAQLPLMEPTFFILLSLAPGPKHGYAVLKDVEALSHGRIVLSTGTLYGALKRLVDQGWIKRLAESEAYATDRSRKAYALTALGRRILSAEVDRLKALVAAARLRSVEENS